MCWPTCRLWYWKNTERRRQYSIVRSIRTRTRSSQMKHSCKLPRSIWRHSATAINLISYSNTTTLPVSIYTSYHFGWTIVDGRLTISSRNGRARRLPMPWKENLVSFQVQRLLTKRWKKCPRLIPPKEISRSKCQMLSEWYWNIIIFAPWVSWTPSFLHTTLPERKSRRSSEERSMTGWSMFRLTTRATK